jgi:uncharacterized membrane protein YjdF
LISVFLFLSSLFLCSNLDPLHIKCNCHTNWATLTGQNKINSIWRYLKHMKINYIIALSKIETKPFNYFNCKQKNSNLENIFYLVYYFLLSLTLMPMKMTQKLVHHFLGSRVIVSSFDTFPTMQVSFTFHLLKWNEIVSLVVMSTKSCELFIFSHKEKGQHQSND